MMAFVLVMNGVVVGPPDQDVRADLKAMRGLLARHGLQREALRYMTDADMAAYRARKART